MPVPVEVTAEVTPAVVGVLVAGGPQVSVSSARFVWIYSPNPGEPIAPRITAQLSGSGVLSADVLEQYARAAELAGTGVLSSDVGIGSDSIAAVLSGAGAFSATVALPLSGAVSVTLSGSGSLVATVSEQYARTASLSGSGSLSGTVGIGSDSLTAALSGAGSLSAIASEQYARAATYSGEGTLSASVVGHTAGAVAATLSGSGVLIASVGVSSDSVPATLSGTGILTATAAERYAQTVTLSGAGVLSSTVGVSKDSISAVLNGSGALTATASESYARTATLSGFGALASAVGISKDSLPAALSGSGTLAAVTSASYARTASLSGVGTLSGTVGISKDSITGSFAGEGTLSATVSAGATGVAFDAVSSVSSGYVANSFSFSFTAASGADVFLCITANFGSNNNTALSDVKYGSSSMTLVTGGQQANNGSNGCTYVYRLAGGGTGSALNLTGTWASATHRTCVGISFTGVASCGTTVKAQGASTSPSTGSATCPTNGMLLSVIGQGGYYGSHISAPTGGTNRAIGNQVDYADVSGIAVSTATATTTFGATLANAYNWGAVVVPLSP